MKLNDFYPNLKKVLYFKNIKDNSKDVKKNDIFVAVKGQKNNGNDYISEAISNGASFIISDRKLSSFPSLYEKNPKVVLNSMLNYYYQSHSKMDLTAVTGTDGKTTISSLLYHILSIKYKTILVSTNGIYYLKRKIKTKNTTPSNTILYETLEDAYYNKIRLGIVEMSSEAIKDNRGMFMSFNGLIISNITREHLNTHKTMHNYIHTKLLLLNNLKSDAIVILNNDMKYYNYVRKRIKRRVITYGILNGDYRAKNIHYSFYKTIFDLYYLNHYICQIETSLFGIYNVYNVLSVIAYLSERGFSINFIRIALKDYIHIEGRFDHYIFYNRHFIIDFGHTPNGIYQTLKSIKEINNKKIISIIGAQGGKDRGKRCLMGKYASTLSDIVILTSEDPKDESLFRIIYDLSKKIKKDYYITLKREDAINLAIDLSNDEDIIIIFGKGNENFFLIKNYKFKYNDLDTLKRILYTKGFLS